MNHLKTIYRFFSFLCSDKGQAFREYITDCQTLKEFDYKNANSYDHTEYINIAAKRGVTVTKR